MIHRIDDRLRDEAGRFHLVFACPDCAQFDPETSRCALGYPNQDHLERSLEGRDEVTFCKLFELG